MSTHELPTRAGRGFVAEVSWMEAAGSLPAGFTVAFYEPGAKHPDLVVFPEECATLQTLIERTWGEVAWDQVDRLTMKSLALAPGRRAAEVTALISRAVA